MKTISYQLRIPENIMSLADLRSEEEYVDKSTALRQLLYVGAEDYVLELYSKGRLSLSRVAEILNKNVHDIIRIAREKGIRIDIGEEELNLSESTAKKIV